MMILTEGALCKIFAGSLEEWIPLPLINRDSIHMAGDNNSGSKRAREITERYLEFIDRHIEDVVSGRATELMQLAQIASQLAVSHTHLTDTVQKTMGHHPCHFYDARIIDKAKQLLTESDTPVSDIAWTLTYDPSNFSKFFKKWTGLTPGDFRKLNK
ncbi:MAG: AraC family transcriptional regulator [Chitinophagaceae bacterium]